MSDAIPLTSSHAQCPLAPLRHGIGTARAAPVRDGTQGACHHVAHHAQAASLQVSLVHQSGSCTIEWSSITPPTQVPGTCQRSVGARGIRPQWSSPVYGKTVRLPRHPSAHCLPKLASVTLATPWIHQHPHPLPQVYPHGSTDALPFATMGSGSLNAMAMFEVWLEGLHAMLTFQ